jgi:hypothetical protein
MKLDRERSERETAALKGEILAKLDGSKTVTAEDVSSQNELARGLMEVARSLEAVESGVDEERRMRKHEVANLTRTLAETMTLTRTLGEMMCNATGKIGEEMTVMQKSDRSEEYYSKVRQAQDKMSEEIVSLTGIVDSAPWTKSIDQVGQSIKDLANAANADILKFRAELAASQDQVEASRSGLSDLREEMQKELADLRMASQGHRDFQLKVVGQMEAALSDVLDLRQEMLKELAAHKEATEAFQVESLRDMETKKRRHIFATQRSA